MGNLVALSTSALGFGLQPVLAFARMLLPARAAADPGAALLRLSIYELQAFASKHIAWSLCGYGSRVRGTAVPTSDVDAVLILDCRSQDDTAAALSMARTMSNEAHASVALWYVRRDPNDVTRLEDPGRGMSFRSLCMLRHLRHISGDESVTHAARTQYQGFLRALTLESLVKLWHGDFYRAADEHVVMRPSVDGFKRGRGGVIDADFVLILADWLRLHRVKSTRVERALRSAENLIDLLARARMAAWHTQNEGLSGLRARVALLPSKVAALAFRARIEAIVFDLQLNSYRTGFDMKCIAALKNRYFHVIFSLGGLLFLLLAVIAGVPGGSGGAIELRSPMDAVLASMGAAFLLLGMVISVVHRPASRAAPGRSDAEEFEDIIRNPTKVEPAPRPQSLPTREAPSRTEQAGNPDPLQPVLDPSAPDYADRLALCFMSISRTQRAIVCHLYQINRGSEISVNALVAEFNAKQNDVDKRNGVTVPDAEMYYRLCTLELLGFVRIRRIEARRSLVIKIQEVDTVIRTRNLHVS